MILGLFRREQKPRGRDLRDPTPRHAIDWIIAKNETLLIHENIGRLATPEGKVAIVDPMVHDEADFIDVPTDGAQMVRFRDPEGVTSKFALVFSDAPAASGSQCHWCSVDSVSTAPATPRAFAALSQLRKDIGPDANIYDHYFAQFECVDAPDATLPDGAHLPYITAPDDGIYPVSELRSASGEVVAVFIDFLGRTDEYDDWLIPCDAATV